VLRRQHHVIEAFELLGDGIVRLLEPPRVRPAQYRHGRPNRPSEWSANGWATSPSQEAVLCWRVWWLGTVGQSARVATKRPRRGSQASPLRHVRMLSGDDGLHVQAVAAPAGQAAPVVPQHAALRQSASSPQMYSTVAVDAVRCMIGHYEGCPHSHVRADRRWGEASGQMRHRRRSR